MSPAPADSGTWARFEHKLDRVSEDVAALSERIAIATERFAPRTDVAEVKERVAVLEADARKLFGLIAGTATIAAGAAATAIVQLVT
jgi:hypothetical protein